MSANKSITIAARLLALCYKEEDLKRKFPEDVLSLSDYDSSFARFQKDNAHKLSRSARPAPLKVDLKYILLFLAAVTGTAGAIIAIWTYGKFTNPYSLEIGIADISDKPNAEEIKALVSKMSQILVLPKDELPTVLVISDLT